MFGAGVWGYFITTWLEYCGLEYHFFCDNDVQKEGKEFLGKKIISFKNLIKEHRDAWVFIATETYEQKIIQQLLENGFIDKQIIRLSSSFEKDKMYRDDSILSPQKREIFIDGGSYDGKDSFDFIDWAGEDNIQKVYAFEPSYNNYVECQKKIRKNVMLNMKY